MLPIYQAPQTIHFYIISRFLKYITSLLESHLNEQLTSNDVYKEGCEQS